MVAASRNQVTPIRLRGMFIEEMNRNTKKIGKRLWIASPEPVLSAAKLPAAPKASAISAEKTSSTATPPMPAAGRTPTTRPTRR